VAAFFACACVLPNNDSSTFELRDTARYFIFPEPRDPSDPWMDGGLIDLRAKPR
jgi:hypothetical protein